MTVIDSATRAAIDRTAAADGRVVDWRSVEVAVWKRVSERAITSGRPDQMAGALDEARTWAISAASMGHWWVDGEAVAFAHSQAARRLAAVREENGQLVEIQSDGSRKVLD